MSQTNGITKLAYSRTWHHISASTPHHALSTIRPLPSASSPSLAPPSLGRLASRIAILLMGKHKPIFDPSTDCGDYVVVTNCSKLHTTGKKRWQKTYYRHNTRPGSLRSIKLEGRYSSQELLHIPSDPVDSDNPIATSSRHVVDSDSSLDKEITCPCMYQFHKSELPFLFLPRYIIVTRPLRSS
ncbi:hypothetical protein D0Z07_5182 [Hyphodiscus hymeniophilus]|uniref:Uncharacterized protein n=1 Tax=Hyphodiscus hymeniophilus TaxID=353542 RepID=A0A9P6VIY2_9HELO|nr:hypothetical protein D0Z07_5182 [Hyphodiscus hymeniophilus]